MENGPLIEPLPDVTVYDVQLSHPEDATSAPPYFHSSPLRLLVHDLSVLLRNSSDIINIFRPFPRPGSGDNQKNISILGLVGQVVFVLVSLAVTGLMLASFTIGFPAPFISVVVWVATLMTMSRLQGRVRQEPVRDDKFKDEAWIFVNGIATSASGLQLILEYLHKKFGRNVIGIHNRTFGIWWDLVECMLQRDFLWPTADVRVGYDTIVTKIRDDRIKKVVLLAHSQGGIIMSTWTDQLLADFAAEELAKVEIYTFAAAANHFSVPYTIVKGQKRFVFGAVEHFANTRDYVSRIGVLAFAPTAPDGTQPGHLPDVAAEGRFAGRIFRREGVTGHMLLSHYFGSRSSILDHPTVRKYSQLVKYLESRSPDTVQRIAKADTVRTETPGQTALLPSL